MVIKVVARRMRNKVAFTGAAINEGDGVHFMSEISRDQNLRRGCPLHAPLVVCVHVYFFILNWFQFCCLMNKITHIDDIVLA